MFSEKEPTIEQEPKIVIKRSSEAPAKIKENPFYDAEFWGRANSPDNIYLPDSDEAISFAIAAHEIGHLVDEGKRDDASLDNFEAARAEEQRAWDKGWKYLQKHIADYYPDQPKVVVQIQQAFERIKDFLMSGTDLSQGMYLEPGALAKLNAQEIDELLKERREVFFTEKGEEFQQLFEEMKKEKIGVKPDWEKFTALVKKAVEDILKDNKKINTQS